MEDPQRDETTIEVDIRLSTLKPRHGKLMGEMCDYFQTKDGKRIIASGWRAAGISKAVNDVRDGYMPSLDPFV